MLRSTIVLLLSCISLCTRVTATLPGDVMVNTQTGKAIVSPVTQLTDGLPSNPSMMTYINNWMKLVSLLPFDVPANKPQPAECKASVEDKPPVVNRISDDLARTYAKFAGASYCLADNMIRSWTCLGHCKDGTEGTEVIMLDTESLTDIKYYVAVNHRLKAIILSIRGTLTPINAIVDFSWVPLDLSDFPGIPKGTMAHAGFLVSALRISGATQKKMVELANQYPSYSVDFTGHSLGGATAQLSALHFATSTSVPPSRIRVITYAAPRVGNPMFAKVMGYAGFKMLARVTFNNDPVPHLPPSNVFDAVRFQHIPGEKYLSGWWIYKDIEEKTGWLGWTMSRIRDIIGFKPKITECLDNKCEDPNCSNSRVPYLNLLMHLRVYDITFGPWC